MTILSRLLAGLRHERSKRPPELTQSESKSVNAVLITQWYAPEPVSVPVLTAKELAQSGLNVKVLTGIPNRPGGKVHAPYKAWKTYEEIRDGIRILRAPLYPNHSTSAVKRMCNYLSWAASATLVGWKLLRDSDVNVVHCTPATAAIPALVARWIHGTPYIVIVQDLWPDTVTASGFVRTPQLNRIATRILEKAVAILYGNATHIAVISDGMKQTLEERGFKPEKISRIFNSVDETIFAPRVADDQVRSRYGIPDDAFLVVYAGNHGSAQNLEPLVRAIAELNEHGVELLLVGWGVEKPKLEELAHRIAPDNIHFVDRVPPEEVHAIQSTAQLCVVSLKDDPLFRITIPSKLQTLLASQRTILGVVAGDPSRILHEASAGFVAEPGNTESIKETILTALMQSSQTLELMGESGRAYYLAEMSSRQRSSALHRLFRKTRRINEASLSSTEASATRDGSDF